MCTHLPTTSNSIIVKNEDKSNIVQVYMWNSCEIGNNDSGLVGMQTIYNIVCRRDKVNI